MIKSVTAVTVSAMILETVFVLWPLVCSILGSGIMFWERQVKTSALATFSLVSAFGIGLFRALNLGLLRFALFKGVRHDAFYYALSSGLRLGLFLAFVISISFSLFLHYIRGFISRSVSLVHILSSVISLGLLPGLGWGYDFGLLSGLRVGLLSGLVVGSAIGFMFGFFYSSCVSGLVTGLGILAATEIGVLIVLLVRKLGEGARDTFTGFLRPWDLKTYSFWKAIGFFSLVYMVMVLIFSFWYYTCYLEGIEELLPGGIAQNSFFKTQTVFFTGILGWWNFAYFSFITITSLGYGDIFPIHPLTQVLVVVETLIGIGLVAVYLAIILKLAAEEKAKKREVDYDENIDY